MRIMFMGTAAAEGYPALFCVCDRCKKARELGGRNFRSRSQALIDGRILIDFNHDALYHSKLCDIDYTYIKSLLITHRHEDHFSPYELNYRNRGAANLDEGVEKLQIYGPSDIKPPLERFIRDDNNYGFDVNTVEPFEPFDVEGYTVTVLKAVHGGGALIPYIYLIEKDGKALLYAHDTGILPDETFDYLKDNNKRLDFVSLDCTEGTKKIQYLGHMNLERNIIVRDRLIENGSADSKTIFCLNHFSHNGENTLYDDMCAVAEKHGFIVSYDGMTVDF